MEVKIALAGNPNSGKTTLFNALTGSNQYVGNWPGVTVEKKEGRLKGRGDMTIQDLPGIYSLSPYTLEETVARDYLTGERPDAVLNIVDATNLERNLYLTTQLLELGLPVVLAVNMMDLAEKNGDRVDLERLSAALGCPAVADSSLLAALGGAVSWIFYPLGWMGSMGWKATVASVTGLIAKENVIGTLGVLYHVGGELGEEGDRIWSLVAADFNAATAYSFLVFNLLCAPCFAAMGAIRREMNNPRWTAAAIGYMCLFAYAAALVVYQLGGLLIGVTSFGVFTLLALAVLAGFLYLLLRRGCQVPLSPQSSR